MPQPLQIGDQKSVFFDGLTGFWTRYWRDTPDLHAFYNASELYIGQVYLDMLSDVLNHGIVDMPIFNKEYWKFFVFNENDAYFMEGVSAADDRYVFDMPGTARTVDFLQSCIFNPLVVYERGVDFDVQDEDGFARFLTDPFRDYLDVDGAYLPKKGVNWRSIDIEVGNQLIDLERTTDWRLDSDTKVGDTLRLLAQSMGVRVDDAGANPGQVFYVVGTYRFYTAYVLLGDAIPGDVIQVYGSGTAYDGYYVIKEVPDPYMGFVELEETFHAPLATSAATLRWKLLKMAYFDFFVEDHEIDYIDVQYLVGKTATPYPLGLVEPLVYAVVRDIAEPSVLGLPVSPVSPTDTGYTHIIPGTVKIAAQKMAGGAIKEGVDYVVNYLTGVITPLPTGTWNPISINTCSFQYRKQVLKSAGGSISERTVGTIKQIAMWAPEVLVDKFNLYYHYGYLLNRFEISSDAYKSFLRGVMNLYMHGPIFEQMVSGMNIVAGYPVVKQNGELLVDYFNGIDAQDAIDGQIVGAAKTFTTTAATYTFTELDVGGYIIFDSPVSSFNKGKFLIESLVDSQTVLLESTYPMVDEGPPLSWTLSRKYEKLVTTNQNTYAYPYFVPMRADIEDPENLGVLYLNAFEALTTAFTVTDYVEAPTWWVGKTLPYSLFPDARILRRIASDALFAHIVDPDDLAAFDDPGLYFDGDDEGVVTSSVSGLSYRHNVGFVLFDKYLKYHMFYVAIDPALELPLTFRNDFEDIVMAIKPVYTYGYVEPSEPFLDEGTLWDTFSIPKITLNWGTQESIISAGNELVFDAETDLAFDDYFTYTDYAGIPVPPHPPLAPFFLSLAPGERLIAVNIHATTLGAVQVVEFVDYTVDYDPNSATFGMVQTLTLWGPGATYDMSCAAIVNAAAILPAIPDTRIGYTPLILDGWDPAYVRKSTAVMSLQTEHVSRPISLLINANTAIPGGVSYPYP